MDDHIKAEISSYLAGALTESRNRQIEAHVASCEKCRLALTRARNKQARVKREALKKAATEKVPNLFFARQGKDPDGGLFGSSALLKKGALLALVAGGIYWGIHRKPTPPAVVPDETPVPATDTPAPAKPATVVEAPKKKDVPPAPVPAPVATPTPAAVPAPVKTEVPVVLPKAPEVPKVPLVLPVQQSWKGGDSAYHETKVLVARQAEGFQKLWTDMKMADPLPAIDFTEKAVIAIFAGPYPAGSAIEIGKIEETDGAMVAPYRVVVAPAVAAPTPIPGSTVTVAAPAPAAPASYPYLLAVVPRTDRKIKITRRESL